MFTFNWANVLSAIRDGKQTVPIDPKTGIPLVAVNAPLYELMELLEALTTGYNNLVLRDAENQKKAERLRKLAEKAFPGCNSPADGWISVEDMLPPKSGEYFTYGSSCGVYPLSYSAKYKLWNAHDTTLPEEARKSAFTEITHWYPQPQPPVVEDPAAEEG